MPTSFNRSCIPKKTENSTEESEIVPPANQSHSLPTRPSTNIRLPEYLKHYEVSIEYCEALLSEQKHKWETCTKNDTGW